MGAEILLGLGLAFVVLGPKRMQSLLGHVGRAKAELDKSARRIRSQLAEELAASSGEAALIGEHVDKETE